MRPVARAGQGDRSISGGAGALLPTPCHFYEESRGLVRSGQLSYSLLLLSILLYLVIVWLWVFYRFTSLVPFPPLVFDLLAVREQRGFVHHSTNFLEIQQLTFPKGKTVTLGHIVLTTEFV